VAHDAARPFVIALGPRTVTVVGTEFDILRHEGRLAVTVRRGVVEVAEAADTPVRLTAGRRLRARGDDAPAVVETIAEAEADGWRTGRLIYREQPFGDVVSDLGRYFDEPLRIEGRRTAGLRFSGVLVVGREDEMIRRIKALLAVSAARDGGAIVFRSND
jgi:transmembrane sensor